MTKICLMVTSPLTERNSFSDFSHFFIRLARVEDDSTKVVEILKNMCLTKESLISAKVQSESDIKQLQTELGCVEATSCADEVAMTLTMKTLQTEKDKLLDDKSAQQLQNDAIIIDLNNELRKLKLKAYANDVVVENLSSPVRNSTQKYQNGTKNSKNVIDHSMQNDAFIPNNEFGFSTNQNDVIGIEAFNLTSPDKSELCQITIQEDKVAGEKSPMSEVSSSSQSPKKSPIRHEEKVQPRQQKPKKAQLVKRTSNSSPLRERIFKTPVSRKKNSELKSQQDISYGSQF